MDTELRHDAEASRYELLADGRVVGVADYRAAGSAEVFHHTEIERELQGQGLGERLVRGALDDVRRRGARIVATCWFVADFVAEHPEYADLVANEDPVVR